MIDHKAFTRRDFIKSTAFLGGFLAAGGVIPRIFEQLAWAKHLDELDRGDYEYQPMKPENVIYSACLQCHTACPIKCKLIDGVLVKIDGNPYCPQAKLVNTPYHSSLAVGAREEGQICPKGQSGIETLYDPYRIRKVLKRVGPRGSHKWRTIDFHQAVDEIVNGGDLFGEGHVDGLKEIYVLRDKTLSKQMAADVKAIQSGKMTVAQFQRKHKDHLDVLMDPDHPDLGPKNNQFVFQAGRIEHGRKELMKWFTHEGFGSVNAFEHTTICEQSHHIAYAHATNQWKDGKWQKGSHHMKPDFNHAEYVIFFGTGAFEANFGPPLLAGLVSQAVVERNFKYAVVDPRLSKTAAKADRWVPIRPGGDAALALGMIRWIMENERYDKTFLENANKAAAAADNEVSWSTASYLVKIEDGRPARYLRADEVQDESGAPLGTKDQFVVSRGGNLLAVTSEETGEAVEGDLFTTIQTDEIKAESAFSLLKKRVEEFSLHEYAEQAGLRVKDITELADEFTSHGKKASAEMYRGPVQHTNGYYNGQAIVLLNVLVGNSGWKGGLSAGGSHWHEYGGKPGSVFNFKGLNKNKLTAFGIKCTREGSTYEKTTLFNGYPAPRPFYPLTGNVYQEIIPSIAEGYPYQAKCLFLHKGTPALSCPSGHKVIDILKDPKKIPLFIACDIVVGETSMYADYIFPDLSIWERWGTPHVTPAMLTTVSKVRQPVVAPITETTSVDGHEMPISMETFLIAVGKKLGLSGFGKDAFGPGLSFDRAEDWFLKLVANIAMGDKKGDAVPEADDEEMEIFFKARRHLPSSVFDPERWKKAVGPQHWRRVVYVLNRGGRFMDTTEMYQGDKQQHPWKHGFNLFAESVATVKNSMTGEYFDGLPRIEPVREAAGNEVKDSEYRLRLITYKEIFGGQSRTAAGDIWLRELWDDNGVLINRRDAENLGLKEGDQVKLVSRTLPDGRYDLRDGRKREVTGRLKVIEGIRPGVIAVSWSKGHWAYGSHDIEVDGIRVKGDPRRSQGTLPNPAFREDLSVKNVCLTDPIGGSASYYDTQINLTKVS